MEREGEGVKLFGRKDGPFRLAAARLVQFCYKPKGTNTLAFGPLCATLPVVPSR